jgi:hypothetical protein
MTVFALLTLHASRFYTASPQTTLLRTLRHRTTTVGEEAHSNWFCRIAFEKPNYPALKKIVLWQGPCPVKRDHFDPEAEPGCADLLSATKTAEIDISWRKGRLSFGE